MTPRTNALLLAIVCAGLPAGCAVGPYQRTLIPPATPEGQACLPKCDLTRTQCEGRQNGREQECRWRNATAKSEYDTCVRSGAETCKAPEPCMGTDMEICQVEYEDCYKVCGGRVETVFTLKQPGRPAGSAAGETAADAADPP